MRSIKTIIITFPSEQLLQVSYLWAFCCLFIFSSILRLVFRYIDSPNDVRSSCLIIKCRKPSGWRFKGTETLDVAEFSERVLILSAQWSSACCELRSKSVFLIETNDFKGISKSFRRIRCERIRTPETSAHSESCFTSRSCLLEAATHEQHNTKSTQRHKFLRLVQWTNLRKDPYSYVDPSTVSSWLQPAFLDIKKELRSD